MKLHLVDQLKKPTYLLTALGIAFVLFDIDYYFMASFPGSRDEMCVMNINLTPGNIIFSILVSLLTGIVIAGLMALLVMRSTQRKTSMAAVSGLGVGLGTLTVFCPVCALPVFAIGGTSVVLELFNQYGVIFKILSLSLLLGTLWYLNKKLDPECLECKRYVPKKQRSK
ncbi:hypothetical protein IT413_06585 [Candidatus Peregrinibacteria bacterium]|nr:hypothetical protein [Candidatus Peregrinibacteria bacterium]